MAKSSVNILVSTSFVLTALLLTALLLYKRHGFDYYPEASKNKLEIIKVYVDFEKKRKKPIFLHKEAAQAFEEMKQQALKDGIELLPLSGFRTKRYQDIIYKESLEKSGLNETLKTIAPPGRSEHHTGYAVDFAFDQENQFFITPDFAKTEQYQWLVKNAEKYGFENAGSDSRDKTPPDPWHWRYIGSSEAKRKFYRNEYQKFLDFILDHF